MASVIETLFYLFDADASKLDKGLKEADKKTKDVEKGLLSTDAVAAKLGKTFKDSIVDAAKTFVGFMAIRAIRDQIAETIDLTEQTRLASKEALVAVDVFSQWSNAVQATGGSQEGFISTLDKLRERTPTPLRLLTQLADQFKGLSDFRARRLADMWGIDHGMVSLLQQGRKGLDEMLIKQAALGIVTKEQAEAFKRYKDQLRDTNRMYEDTKRQILLFILPAVTKFLTGVEEVVRFARENKTVVVSFFAAAATAITAVFLPAIVSATIATFTFLAPWLLIGAAVAAVAAAFALAYDDVTAFLNGQDSVIGELAKKWPIVGDVVRAVADNVRMLWDVIKTVAALIFDAITQGPEKAFENLANAIPRLIDNLRKLVPQFDLIMKGAESIGAALSRWFGNDAQPVPELAAARQQTAMTRTPLNSVPSAVQRATNNNQRTTHIQTGPITVEANGADPDSVVRAVGTGLGEQLRQAINAYDDGVAG